MALKGTKPEPIEKRLKMFVYGPPAVGKTTAAIQFPNNYIIDMERGTDFYAESINKAGSVVFKTTSAEEVEQEVKALLTTPHSYRTLTIDPITQLYHSLQDGWTRIFEKHAKTEKEAEMQDFGMRYWGRVKSDYKAILRALLKLDMNVIITSHQKDVYGPGMQKIGVGADSMKGDEYVFDYVFQLENTNGKRIARTIKERSEVGKNKFPETFDWSYENFCKYYGAEVLEREAAPVKMASPEQVTEIKRLVDLVKVDEATISGWFTKADVNDWSEMTGDMIQKCIGFVQKKLEPVKGSK